MSPELEYLVKYAPALGVLVATIILIAYTKKSLFQDVISKEMFQTQLEREREFVIATKEAASHLDEISRQLESSSHKQSESVKAQTDTIREMLQDVADRLRTLELVFSDNIDALRNLTYQVEKHRKGIPETEMFVQPRKDRKYDSHQPKKD